MSENGTEKPANIWREVTDQVSDHVDLAALELRFEAKEAGRRLVAGGIILILVLTAFIILQIALIGLLMRAGLSMDLSALLLCVLYFAAGFGVYWKLGRRDGRAGPPFVGTQKELHQTIRWIQKIFS